MTVPTPDDREGYLRMAIAVMTAWAEMDGDDRDASIVPAVITGYLEDGADVTDLLAGLISLSGILLERVHRTTGIEAIATLQDLGRIPPQH